MYSLLLKLMPHYGGSKETPSSTNSFIAKSMHIDQSESELAQDPSVTVAAEQVIVKSHAFHGADEIVPVPVLVSGVKRKGPTESRGVRSRAATSGE